MLESAAAIGAFATTPPPANPPPAISLSPILALVALAFALGLGYLLGRGRRERAPTHAADASAPAVPAATVAATTPTPAPLPAPAAAPPPELAAGEDADAEPARLIRGFDGETVALRRSLANRDAELAQLREFAVERRRLFSTLADTRADTARYRQIIVDLEDNAPPPLLGGPGAPDDLKLIVGVGPVLERMLYQLGVTTYRQIARWTERDIDDFDARLHEFPGRIRRDGWVTQARALHQSKYGAPPPARDRG
jgi:predicted flap endonuclease-1-like 5' DNA nuclease